MSKGTITSSGNGAADTSGSLSDTAKGIAAKGKEKLEAVKETALDVKAKVVDAKDMVVDKSTAGLEKVRRFAEANPFKTIAIAFGVGYLGMRVTRLFR